MRSLSILVALCGAALVFSGCSDDEDATATIPEADGGVVDPDSGVVDELNVFSMTPNAGPVEGGTSVVVLGRAFVDGAQVTFGETAGADTTWLSATQLRVTTPAGAGAVAVTVTNPDGASKSLAAGFSYREAVEDGVDWCMVQYPASLAMAPGAESAPVFVRAFEAGCTEGEGRCAALRAELGYGALAANASTSPEAFTWKAATYNEAHTDDDNDEHLATLTVAEAGHYAYAYRVSLDGERWTYCDFDGTDNGFQTDQMGALMVEENVQVIGWCALHWPQSTQSAVNAETEAVFARVFVEGCTEGEAACGAIEAELGYGDGLADPSATPEAFTWAAAAKNEAHIDDDNDEHTATLTVATAGDYAYAYRARVGGDWTYCDLDGSDNGFQREQMGALTVTDAVDPDLSVGWCQIQHPATLEAAPGLVAEAVYGQVFVDECSNEEIRCEAVTAQLGLGARGADPRAAPETFTWTDAAYNEAHVDDNNDEYQATFSAEVGVYSYAYRFSVDGVAWTYCDLDGDDGFQAEQTGSLTVADDAPPALSVGWCEVTHPATLEAIPATEAEPVYGRVYVETCSEMGARCEAVTAQLGFGGRGDDPQAGPERFIWTDAAYNEAHVDGNNDEYQATFSAEAGIYSYAYRFSVDGVAWTYCDLDGDDGFQAEQLGEFDVAEPVSRAIEWCDLHWPGAITVAAGTETEAIYGRVFAFNCTEFGAYCDVLSAEVGVGPADGDAQAAPEAFTWTSASYNEAHVDDNNDEYMTTLTPNDAGTYRFVYRFSGDGGTTWTVCDTNGGEFSAGNSGVLLVE